MRNQWQLFDHGADIGVRGIGETEERAFEMGAMALTAVAVDPAEIEPRQEVALRCQAPDREILFVEWLNALVFETATRRMLFSRFEVRLAGDELRGKAWGECMEGARHQPAVEVKGATFTELKVSRQADGSWMAQCVVDV